MSINTDLLTPAERAIYERHRRVATSDVLALLEALCEARQERDAAYTTVRRALVLPHINTEPAS